MIVYIGLLAVSVLLIGCAGAWAYIFFMILRHGKVALYESNLIILKAEFGTAVVLTLVGIFFFVVAIRGLKKLS